MTQRLFVPLIAALALRLGFGLLYWVDKPLTHDEREYLLLAKNIAAGKGFGYPDEVPQEGARFGRAPFYPLCLAAVMVVTGATSPDRPLHPADDVALLRAIKIVQAIVGAAGVWVIGALAASVAGFGARWWAMWIAAVYPPLVWICAYVLSEALYSTMIIGSALVLGRVIDNHRTGVAQGFSLAPAAGLKSCATRLFLAGILAGLSALTRPAALFFIGCAGLWMLWQRQWRWVAVFAVGAALTIGPWTIRNVREYGSFVLIASEGGVTFWTGNHALARGEGDLAANPDIKRANLEFRANHPHLGEEALEPIYYAEAVRYITTHPMAWTALTFRKVFYLWVPVGPSYRLHSTRYYWASVLSYGVLLPVAIAGVVRIRRGRSRPRAMWLLAGSAVLMCLVFFPQERFRLPVIDPVLIVCAAYRLTRPSSAPHAS